jgi:aminopeptidase N
VFIVFVGDQGDYFTFVKKNSTMKRLFTLSLLCGLLYVVQAQDNRQISGAWSCSQRKMQMENLPDLKMYSPNAPVHSFDVLKYTLDLDLFNCYITPYPKSFTGSVIVSFRADSVIDHIVLNAVNTSLTIDSVSMSGVSFTHSTNLLDIELDRAYNPGEETDVKIYYKHKNVSDGALYVNTGFLFTDCEPEGARKWFPCYDKPSDKAKTDVTTKVPLNVKLASNGRLQDSIVNGDTLIYHWISRDPVATYLTILTSRANFNLDIVNWTNPNTGEVTPMRFYYNPGENPTGMETIFPDMVTFYSQEFGDHPFEKNGFATLNSDFSWGGMENQTLTSLCANCWSESLIAHEFAHQWFGDMITCATWADIWLNEGFATWTEAHWTEFTDGYTAYKNEIKNNADYYLLVNHTWPISDPDWAINTPSVNILFDYAVTYMKGSCVLYQLRNVMGDSAFFAGMKAYATDTVDFKYKSATIGDFKDKMEAVSGQELDYFFDEWIFIGGHPTYQNVYSIQPNGDGWRVYFTFRQTGNTAYWQMPAELRIRFEDNSDTIITVFNSFNGQIFTFDFPDRRPTTVFFDPNTKIVLKKGTTAVSVEEPALAGQASVITSIAPNPGKDKVEINYNLEKPTEVKLTVYNMTGSKVSALNQGLQIPGDHSLTMDVSALKPGVYTCVLQTTDGVNSAKMIIAR